MKYNPVLTNRIKPIWIIEEKDQNKIQSNNQNTINILIQKIIRLIFFAVLISVTSAFGQSQSRIESLIDNGDFTLALKAIEHNLKKQDILPENEIQWLINKKGKIIRIKRDYSMAREELIKRLEKRIPNLTTKDIDNWDNDYSLEHYIIDGKKMYYYNCIFDLFQVNKEAANRSGIKDKNTFDYTKYPLKTIQAFIKDTVFSKTVFVGMSYFQNVDIIPRGDKLRAWIPYPRENKLQENIQIVETNISNYHLPKKESLNSMIYFEHTIDNGYNSLAEWELFFAKSKYDWMYTMEKRDFINDSTFLIQFIYQYKSNAVYNKIDPKTIEPYYKKSEIYENNTMETLYDPHTEYLKNLAKKITGNENNPYIKAKLIYTWICENIVWTQPKTVMDPIEEYTAKYKRGDCYAKSELFKVLCRISGVPARDQGGWIVRPNRGHAQHTWSQVFFEPYGWLPVDATIGRALIHNEDERLKYFYFGNCTPHHFIIYDGDGELNPPKEYPCIYDGGYQTGIFQWEKGDLEPFIKIDSYVEPILPHKIN